MLKTLPRTVEEIKTWQWPDFEPYYRELEERTLNQDSVADWLADWSHLSDLMLGRGNSLRVAVSCNTADTELEARLNHFLGEIFPQVKKADHALTQKLLASGLEPAGMEIPIKKMRVAAEIFRPENLALAVEEQKLTNQYGKIAGAQTVTWEGQEVTVTRLKPLLQSPDRRVREQAWQAIMARGLEDRPAFNDLWGKLLQLRQQMAANAGFSSYRDLRWKQLNRFDYTPADCETFHAAIEEVVVPAARRISERRRRQLGLDTVRPWDLEVDPLNRAPLRPFNDVEELESRAEAIFQQVDPELGQYFGIMRREKLLDLENRKNKAPGGYCTRLPVGELKRPFIFMNAVGVQGDVKTILHEAGHAFHGFETVRLPYQPQQMVGSEFNEVASMAMELLASPYLTRSQGGYYSEEDAARARIEHLESIILFWPYMAVVDSFQHWVYTHPEEARDPANCDQEWGRLWSRFKGDEDWSGLEQERVTGWHRKLHIFQYPFYYVEYGMAQLGSVQIWANARRNQAAALADYRLAQRLGGTVSLPQLYAAAGARFSFDAPALQEAVSLIEQVIDELQSR